MGTIHDESVWFLPRLLYGYSVYAAYPRRFFNCCLSLLSLIGPSRNLTATLEDIRIDSRYQPITNLPGPLPFFGNSLLFLTKEPRGSPQRTCADCEQPTQRWKFWTHGILGWKEIVIDLRRGRRETRLESNRHAPECSRGMLGARTQSVTSRPGDFATGQRQTT